MTVNEYIQQKFQTFGIQLSEADLLDMYLNAKVSRGDEMNEGYYSRVSVQLRSSSPLYCFVPLQSVKAVSLCLGTFKVLRTTIHFCVNSTD